MTSCAARLTKERDAALSKISLWMKTCKQMEQEKQEMINSTGEREKENGLDKNISEVFFFFFLTSKSSLFVLNSAIGAQKDSLQTAAKLLPVVIKLSFQVQKRAARRPRLR